MAVNTYVINKGFDDEQTVQASDIVNVGEFVDFRDGSGLVLRLRAEHLVSVKRQDG